MKLREYHPLHESEKLLSCLMDEIPRVQAFKGKWTFIRAKLTDFSSQLRHLSESPNFPTSQLASELVHSISQTLSNALSLATKCLNPNPIDGKLRTQSDIDSISSKLDQHVNDIAILNKTGALNVVVDGESDSVGSKNDSVRVEVKNLITRLRMGDSELKSSALDELLGLLHEDDKNVLVAVAQGVVHVLVLLLDSSSLEIRENALSAIARVSVVDCCKHELYKEGVFLIKHLLKALDSRSGFAKEKACVALQALSSEENAKAIANGIASVLDVCQFGTLYSQAFATGVLRNLSVFSEIKQNFMEDNAIPVLIDVASLGSFVAQENAIGCLNNLVFGDESLKFYVVKEGGIECLKNFWDSVPMVHNLEVAVGLLRNLASCRPIGEALVSEGFITRLVGVLNCGVVGLRIAAAETVYELGFSSKTRKEMGEVGAIPLLVNMLDAKAIEEKMMAAKALSNLLLYKGNRKIFVEEEKGIDCIIQLLDPSIESFDKSCLISVLASIVNTNGCKKQMVAAGACGHLQKLIEMGIDGAEKLHETLHRNNTWGWFRLRK